MSYTDFRVFVCESPHIVALADKWSVEVAAATTERLRWAQSVSDMFGTPMSGGPRTARLFDRIVVGITRDHSGESAPPGWVWSDICAAFVPDSDTDLGRRIQQEMDRLPALPETITSAMVGQPPTLTLTLQSGTTRAVAPEVRYDKTRRRMVAIWPVRLFPEQLRQIIDDCADRVSAEWREVSRSQFLAELESDEAAATP